mgnify:CR=1 FL=1
MLLGFIGAGGGGVLIGILSGVFGLQIDKAIGTALAAMCVVTVFGAVSHYREGHVAPRIGLIVGVTGIVGAVIGAELGQQVPDRVLELGFSEDHDLMLQIGRALFRDGQLVHAHRFFELAASAAFRLRALQSDPGHSEARTFEIPNVIETNRAIGMCSLDSAIAELYFNGRISREDAIAQAAFPDKLERQLAA